MLYQKDTINKGLLPFMCKGRALFFNDDSIEVYANNNMETIVIDAGHGGYDVGCIALDGT